MNGNELHLNKSLHLAVFEGDEEEVARLLLNPSLDVNVQDDKGFTALHFAVYQGHLRVVHMLLDAGAAASANLQNIYGYTPFHYACINARLECAQLLVPLTDVEVKDKGYRRTGLEHAREEAASYGPNTQRYIFYHALIHLVEGKLARSEAEDIKASIGTHTPQASSPRKRI